MSDSPIDVHVTIAKVLLICQGSILTLMALISPIAGAVGGINDPDLQQLGPIGGAIAVGLTGILCFGTFGGLSLTAALGLHKERPWGWWCGAVAFVIWMSGCGMPIGLYGLFAIARGPVRKHFGIG